MSASLVISYARNAMGITMDNALIVNTTKLPIIIAIVNDKTNTLSHQIVWSVIHRVIDALQDFELIA